MSKVRVLVGTHKGAFILTSDGKRQKWDVSGPHFAGWEIYHLKGSPADPNRIYCLAIQRLVRPDHSALRRWRQNLGAGRQQVRLRRHTRHAPVVRRHAAPLGVQTRLAPRAVAHRSGHGLRRRRRRGHLRSTDGGKNWQELPGLREHDTGQRLAAGRGRHVPAHHPARPHRSQAHLHRHLRRRRVSHR